MTAPNSATVFSSQEGTLDKHKTSFVLARFSIFCFRECLIPPSSLVHLYRSSNAGKLHPGKHDPIITQELFEAAQNQLKRGEGKRQSKEFAFTKIMVCGLCGSGITAEEKYKQLKNDRMDMNELGLRQKFEEEIKRYNKFRKDVLGLSGILSQAVGYLLQSGEFIIGLTREKVTLSQKIGCFLSVRGSKAQAGIDALQSSTFCEPGSDNTMALEIRNNGPYPIQIFPGIKIVKGIFVLIQT